MLNLFKLVAVIFGGKSETPKTQIRRAVPNLEELEDRLVPSATLPADFQQLVPDQVLEDIAQSDVGVNWDALPLEQSTFAAPGFDVQEASKSATLGDWTLSVSVQTYSYNGADVVASLWVLSDVNSSVRIADVYAWSESQAVTSMMFGTTSNIADLRPGYQVEHSTFFTHVRVDKVLDRGVVVQLLVTYDVYVIAGDAPMPANPTLPAPTAEDEWSFDGNVELLLPAAPTSVQDPLEPVVVDIVFVEVLVVEDTDPLFPEPTDLPDPVAIPDAVWTLLGQDPLMDILSIDPV